MLLTAALMSGLLGAGAAHAEIDSIHFLIPGGAGVAGMVPLVEQVKR